MAGKGRSFVFHGAFASKTNAKKKERKVRGFVKRIRVRGQTRWVVLTRRK